MFRVALLACALACGAAAMSVDAAWRAMPDHEYFWFMAVPATSSSAMEQVCRVGRNEHHSVMHRLHAPLANDTAFFGKSCVAQCPVEALPPQRTEYLGRSHYTYSNAVRLRKEGKKPLHVMTMFRDPVVWAQRMWQKRILDPSYERRVGKPIQDFREVAGDAGMYEWIDNAFWKWNFWARALAGDISSHDMMHSDPGKDDITRERALGYILEMERDPDSCELYQKARKRLRSLPFFGMFEDLEETYRLLAYSACWDYDLLMTETKFKVRSSRSHSTLSPQADAYVRQYNIIDLALYEEAAQIFSERVVAMREAQAQAGDNYVCQYFGRKQPCVFECSGGASSEGEL